MKVLANKLFRPVYPSPAAMIVSADADGKPNIMTAAEVFNVGLRNPVIIGIAIRKATYTHGLIMDNGMFTVNFPTVAILEKTDLAGTISGRNGLDKFTEYGLTPLPSTQVTPPIIQECPVNLECKMLSVTEAGDHDLFLGEAVAMHADEDVLDSEQCVLVEKLDAFLFANETYYRFGERLASAGFSRRGKNA